MADNDRAAMLYSAVPPKSAQRARFERFLIRRYGEGITLHWIEDPSIKSGFKLEIGNDLYDWTKEGRFQQFREMRGELQKQET